MAQQQTDFRATHHTHRPPTASRSQDNLATMTSSRDATGSDLRSRFKAIQQQSRAAARNDDVTTSLSDSVASLKKYLPRSDSLFGAVNRRAPMRVPRDTDAAEVTSVRQTEVGGGNERAYTRMQRSSSLETMMTSLSKSDARETGTFAASTRTGRCATRLTEN